MAVLINFKICDNAKDCNGAAACKQKAIFWNESKKTLEIDNDKCLSCGACERVCMVHAIRVAKDKNEYQKIKKEIKEDPRKVSDLFIDRYGATPINPSCVTDQEDFETEIEAYPRLVAAELIKEDLVECLLSSVPIKEVLNDFNNRYRKVLLENDKITDKYKIKKLPALLFLDNGKLVGKIEGHYDVKDKDKLIKKVKIIIKGIKTNKNYAPKR